MKRLTTIVQTLFLFIAVSWNSHLSGAEMVLPPTQTGQFGNSQDALFRFEKNMFAYDGNLFSEVNENLLLIKGLSFRVDENYSLPYNMDYKDIKVWLSTMPKSISQFTTDPASNAGSDRTLVFSAENVRFSGSPSTDPGDFQLTIPLQTFFQYNKFSGPLVMEVEHVRGEGSRPIIDAQVSDRYIRKIFYGGIPTVESSAPVMLLKYTVVPEPFGITLAIFSAFTFFLFRRKKIKFRNN